MKRIKIEYQDRQHTFCFICLHSVNTFNNAEEPASLTFLFKHLKLNLSDLSNATVCENCDKTLKRFLQLCNSITKIKLEMGYCLEVILKTILKAEEVNLSEIPSSRELLLTKCHKEIRRSRPQVKLKRLDPALLENFNWKSIQPEAHFQLSNDVCSDDWTSSLSGDFDSDSNLSDYEGAVLTSEVIEDIKLFKSEIIQEVPKPTGKRKSLRPQQNHELQCPECLKIFKTQRILRDHIHLAHLQIKPSKCDICNRSFSTQGYLKNHNRFVHPELIKSELKHPNPKYKIKCPKCSNFFKTRINLYNHNRYVHLQIKVFKCDICDKSFPTPGALIRHNTVPHSHGQYSNPLKIKFPCKICKKDFSCSSFLEKHLRNVHTERKFACQICDKRFKLKNDLAKHVSSIHEKLRHPCKFPGCNKDYSQHMPLVQHYRICHPGFLKPNYKSENAWKFTVKKEAGKVIFECDICKKTFSHQKNAQQHLQQVHDPKRFECQDCEFKFAVKRGLIIHRKRKHADKLEGSQPKVTVKVEIVDRDKRD